MKNNVRKIFQNPWAEIILRWGLGVTFIYASLHKIVEPAYFAKIIYGYYLLPGYSINLIAIILPYVEFFCGLGLVFGIYPRSSALIILVMLLLFISALSINIIRGHEFDCGCFSFGESGYSSDERQLLLRDVVYFIIGLYVTLFNQTRKWSILQTGGLLQCVDAAESN